MGGVAGVPTGAMASTQGFGRPGRVASQLVPSVPSDDVVLAHGERLQLAKSQQGADRTNQGLLQRLRGMRCSGRSTVSLCGIDVHVARR